MLKNHTCFIFLFSSLMAWRGEMLYAATRMRFFGTRKTLRICFFVSRMLPLTPSRPTKPWTKPWTRKLRKRRNKKQKWDVDLDYIKRWSQVWGVVDAGKMQQCLHDRCRLNKCFKPSSNHKPNIFQSQVRTYLQKNDKAVNVNQLVSHVPDYHNKSSLNASINDIKNQMYKNVKKCIRISH